MGTGRHPFSLRFRVAVAAGLGAVVIATVVAGVLVVLLARREVTALDRRLALLSEVLTVRVSADPAASAAELMGGRRSRQLVRGAANGLVVTVREGGRTRTVGTIVEPPDLPAASGDTLVEDHRYRELTVTLAGGGMLSVGLPEAPTDRAVARVRWDTVAVATAAAVGAAGLGWFFTGRAIRPLRVLRDRTAALSGRADPGERASLTSGPVRAAVETSELADALAGLLGRVESARVEGERALQAARDFAASANHELRTPLTTLRTDLDVLLAHQELPADQRSAVLDQLRASQERLEATLTALGQLAAGELGNDGSAAPVELADVAAQAVTAARSRLPEGMTITVRLPDQDVPVLGSAAGLRLTADNLITNAVRHSAGRQVAVSVELDGTVARLTVDDDGRGVPVGERELVFERFTRGRAVTSPGSGLGLALVAQQTRLHGGRAWLTDSPLGGVRAVLELPLGPHPAR